MSIKFIQLQACSLESFINNSSTSFDVTGFLYNDGITPVAPADIGSICFATLEPRTERMELISFTIDSVTAAGVATLTVIRGLSQKAPYSTGGASFDHESGSKMVISNNPGLLNEFARKDGDETITGLWTFNTAPSSLSPTPATTTSLGNVKLSAPAFTELGVTTITIATPGVVSRATHGLIAGDSVQFTTTGALPTGLIIATNYFVIAAGLTAGAFQLSLTVGGAAINTTGSQSGTHTLYRTTPMAVGNEDLRVPTVNEKAAMAGTSGAPAAGNKYITEEDVSNAGVSGKVVRVVGTSLPPTILGLCKKIITSGASVNVADITTVETNVFSTSIAAGLLGTSNAIRIKLYISSLATSNSASDNLTIRLKYGATTITSFTLLNNTTNNSGLNGIIEGILFADASVTAQRGNFNFALIVDNLDINTTTIGKNVMGLVTGTATENSAVALDLAVSAQWSTASSANDFIVTGYTVELIS